MWQSPIGCLVCTSLLSAILLSSQRPLCGQDAKRQHGEIDSELLIVGGTESGCAAAIQAARMGVRSIVLVSDTKWLGGQFSTEALVAIDESADGIGIRHAIRVV
jgi:heterodisulfide reductase subunit A-like polyferredoxin